VSSFATALEQNGHSKSENSTSVIRALAGPFDGAPLMGRGIAASSSVGAELLRLTKSESATAFAGSFFSRIALTMISANARLSPQLESFIRHSATFMSQEQTQACSRRALRAAPFCAGLRP